MNGMMQKVQETLAAINPQDYQVIAFFVLVAAFELFERLRPARKIDRWADLKIDLLSFSFAVLVNRLCTNVVVSAATAIFPTRVIGGLHAIQALPGIVKMVLAVVVADFCIYWIHRAQHRTDILWRTHAWHHSSEHLYWFSGFLTSFLHSLIYNIPQATVPMLIFNLTPIQTGLCYSVGLLIQFWEHTNLKINIGPLQWLFISPEYHRVHHSVGQQCRMNLGTTFSLWDRMFGTYVDPKTMPEGYELGLGETVDKKKMARMLIGV